MDEQESCVESGILSVWEGEPSGPGHPGESVVCVEAGKRKVGGVFGGDWKYSLTETMFSYSFSPLY